MMHDTMMTAVTCQSVNLSICQWLHIVNKQRLCHVQLNLTVTVTVTVTVNVTVNVNVNVSCEHTSNVPYVLGNP